MWHWTDGRASHRGAWASCQRGAGLRSLGTLKRSCTAPRGEATPSLVPCCVVQMYQLSWAPLRFSSTSDHVNMIQVSTVQLWWPYASAFMYLLMWGAVSKKKNQETFISAAQRGGAWLKVRQEHVTQALIPNCCLQDRNYKGHTRSRNIFNWTFSICF